MLFLLNDNHCWCVLSRLAVFLAFRMGCFHCLQKPCFLTLSLYMDPGGGLFTPKMVEAFFFQIRVLAAATCLGGCAQEVFSRFFRASFFDWFRGCWHPLWLACYEAMHGHASWPAFSAGSGLILFPPGRALLAWEAVHRKLCSRFFGLRFLIGFVVVGTHCG